MFSLLSGVQDVLDVWCSSKVKQPDLHARFHANNTQPGPSYRWRCYKSPALTSDLVQYRPGAISGIWDYHDELKTIFDNHPYGKKFSRKHKVYNIYVYYMTNSYRPGLKKFDWFKAGL